MGHRTMKDLPSGTKTSKYSYVINRKPSHLGHTSVLPIRCRNCEPDSFERDWEGVGLGGMATQTGMAMIRAVREMVRMESNRARGTCPLVQT